jgi:hypothetical protein
VEGDDLGLEQTAVEIRDAPLHGRRWPETGDPLADLDERLEAALPPGQFPEEVAVGEGHRGLGGKRRGQVAGSFGVGPRVPLDRGRRRERTAALPLGVDQLEDADDVSAGCLHG